MLTGVKFKTQNGFTLIELVLSISLGVVAVGAIFFFYLTTVVNSTDILKKTKLNQEVSTVMNLMVQEIRRAGIVDVNGLPYDPVFDLIDVSQNPFNDENHKLKVWIGSGDSWVTPSSNPSTSEGSCITFAYDGNYNYSNISANEVEDEDLFGFRWSGDSIEGRVGDNESPDSCLSADSTWSEITTSDEINVTDLSFDLSNSQCVNRSEPNGVENGGDGAVIDDEEEFDCFSVTPSSGDRISELRVVTISIKAELRGDSDINTALSQQVKVRNDRVYTY